MASKTIKLKLKGLDKVLNKISTNSFIDKNTADYLGATVVLEMKHFISQGISPVKGGGKFTPYKASRVNQEVKQFAKNVRKDQGGYYRKIAKKALTRKDFYPNSVRKQFPDKKLSPVNLSLDNSFIDTIRHEIIKRGVRVGHIKADRHTINLFEAHNEGLNKNVPRRKYLPNKRGDEFAVSIMRLIKEIISDRIKELIKK